MNRRQGLSAAAVLCALVPCGVACSASSDEPTEAWEPTEVGVAQEPIINGNSVIWSGGAPYLLVNDVCSGVAIRNDWVLTATHCLGEEQLGNVSNILIRRSLGEAPLTVAEWVERAPGYDVALVKTREPIMINGSTTGWEMPVYPGSTAALVGQEVRVYGHGSNACNGSGFGTLRTARLVVDDATDSAGRHSNGSMTQSPDKFGVIDPARVQSPFQGDSGGAAVHRSGNVDRLVGILNRAGCLVGGAYVSVNAFWGWAQASMVRYGFGRAAVAGDFDGDGLIELAVGAPLEGADGAGRVYIYGWANGTRTTEAILTRTGGVTRGDRFGGALAAGDLDGDGVDDLVIGAPGAGTSSVRAAGRVYVYRGRPGGPVLTRTLGQVAPESDEGGDHFGSSVAIGNFDRQAGLDIAVGAPQEYTGTGTPRRSGAAFVYTCTTGLVCTQRWLLRQESANDNFELQTDAFGHALAVGDFNADGRDDLAVSAPGDTTYQNNANRGIGSVYVFSFSSAFPTGTKVIQSDPLEEGDRFGYALAAGNFYPGGGDDLAVGAPGEAPLGSSVRRGWVYMYRGNSGSGLTFAQGFGQTGAADRDDFFGGALYGGQLTFSSGDELAVGAPYAGPANAGRVYLAAYQTSGLLSIYDDLDQTNDATASADELGDYYGGGLAGITGRRAPTTGWDNHLFIGVPGERQNSAPRKGALHASVPSSSVSRNLDWIWSP